MAYTDQEIIEQVKNWNFDFICVNPNLGYRNSSRLIEAQHLESKEIVICDFQSARRNIVRFPKYENLKAKIELNKLKFGWICLDTWIKDKKRMAKIQHPISKEVIICRYDNAKTNRVHFPKYYNEQGNINAKEKLNKLKLCFTCLDSWMGKRDRMVKLQHPISKEIKVCKYQDAKKNQVRFPKYENIKAKEKLNKLKFGFIGLESWMEKKTNRYIRMVKLQHSISKEIITCQYQKAKNNQVHFPKYSDITRFEKINELGLKANPQYECISSNCGHEGTNVLSSIKRKDGLGKIKKVKFSYLQTGRNPYNETQNRVEVNIVQPMYERLFKKLKIDYIKESFLGKKRIDYILTINNKKYGLEVKQSNKRYYSSKNQIETYRKLGNLKQYKLEKVFLSDPKGRHSKKGSISIKNLELQLKKLKMDVL